MKSYVAVVSALLAAQGAGAADGVRLTGAQAQSLGGALTDAAALPARLAAETVEWTQAAAAAAAFPSWLDVESLRVKDARELPGIGGGSIGITLIDKGNNTVSLRKPSPAPPRMDRTLYVTLSPFLHAHAVKTDTITRENAAAYRQILRAVQARADFAALQEKTRHAVKSFASIVDRRFPERQSSGRLFTADQIDAFAKANEARIRAASPAVLGVGVGYGLAGTGMPFLVITVKRTANLETTRKAVEAAVPELSRFKGVLGTPNQLEFRQPGRND
ncbi:MAG: hypothetical protein HY078_13360 [Elusimicrobia bacterium]|nr:hypothetical protein [Elusimicrobiota bacterium]